VKIFQIAFARRQRAEAEQIFDLERGNDCCNAGSEPDNYRVGNNLNQRAEARETHDHENNAGQQPAEQ
jgi:hypothetical protein